MSGPLDGVRVVELAGLGPAPFAGMMLADLGAEVTIVAPPADRGARLISPSTDLHNRGKRSILVDLKHEEGAEVVLRLCERSEVLIEGFRPGVAERLGVGPDRCLDRRPSLIYGRMTGYGPGGPWSSMAGHDIDYIALSGVLHAVGPPERPVPPLNLVGDFGGGGMLLAIGVLAALTHARATGEGQVVEAAMVDGSALLTASHHGYMAEGWWQDRREANLLDGGAPFYTTYETADGRHVAVGALEPGFFARLVEGLDLDPERIPSQTDRDRWPMMREIFAARFREKTRDEWAEHFAGTDACVAPVMSMSEAADHPHNVARSTFVTVDGVTQPGPAPRFAVTSPRISSGPPVPGEHTDAVLADLGYTRSEIGTLRESGAIGRMEEL